MKTSLKNLVAALTLTLGLSAVAHAESYMGEVQFFANDFGSEGYLPADGRVLSMSQYPALMAIVGCDFGGDCRNTFALPNVPPMKDASTKAEVKAYISVEGGVFPNTPAYKTFGETVLMAGNIDNRGNPALARNVGLTIKTLNGPDLVAYTATQGSDRFCESHDYTSQVKLMVILKKYDDGMMAKGQILPIRDNNALFSLLWSKFGGDTKTTFGIPNLSSAPEGVQAYVCTKGEYPRHP